MILLISTTVNLVLNYVFDLVTKHEVGSMFGCARSDFEIHYLEMYFRSYSTTPKKNYCDYFKRPFIKHILPYRFEYNFSKLPQLKWTAYIIILKYLT